MTKVVFFRSGGSFYGFEEQGHSGFADAGEDILCAALSAMTMLIINTVEGAAVTAKVVANGKGKKIYVMKYKAKKNEKKKIGHRQDYTKIQIEKIEA